MYEMQSSRRDGTAYPCQCDTCKGDPKKSRIEFFQQPRGQGGDFHFIKRAHGTTHQAWVKPLEMVTRALGTSDLNEQIERLKALHEQKLDSG